MTRPVDWWGQAVERESQARLEQATARWWRRERRALRLARWGMWATLAAAIVASLWLVLDTRRQVDTALAEAARVRAEAAALREQMDLRRCAEWPEWCRGQRKARNRHGRGQGSGGVRGASPGES